MDLIDRLGGIYEVVPKGYSKGTAIDFILKHFGLGLDDAYVFGDSSNDLAMFTYGKHTVLWDITTLCSIRIRSMSQILWKMTD